MEDITEQKKLEILCAYLPQGVEALVDTGGINPTECKLAMVGCNHARGYFESKHFNGWKSEYKLILRATDDMTLEEELIASHLWEVASDTNEIEDTYKALRYLHSIHVDTFGAIEAGFAVRKNINEKGE